MNNDNSLFFTDDGDDVRTFTRAELDKAIGVELKKAFPGFALEILRLESNRRDREARRG